MGAIIEFITGRNNKLLRDMLVASSLIAVLCIGGVVFINTAVESIRVAKQPLPPRTLASASQGTTTTTTITRSVLDDPVLTGSIGGRPIILDPCTGKEKK